MKATELRELTIEELLQRETELKRELFNLRFRRASGELDNTAELKKTRRDIARVMTVIGQRTQEAAR
jgi:large subunit ribosomal protein L29